MMNQKYSFLGRYWIHLFIQQKAIEHLLGPKHCSTRPQKSKTYLEIFFPLKIKIHWLQSGHKWKNRKYFFKKLRLFGRTIMLLNNIKLGAWTKIAMMHRGSQARVVSKDDARWTGKSKVQFCMLKTQRQNLPTSWSVESKSKPGEAVSATSVFGCVGPHMIM